MMAIKLANQDTLEEEQDCPERYQTSYSSYCNSGRRVLAEGQTNLQNRELRNTHMTRGGNGQRVPIQ